MTISHRYRNRLDVVSWQALKNCIPKCSHLFPYFWNIVEGENEWWRGVDNLHVKTVSVPLQ